jgi:hypothetical protein
MENKLLQEQKRAKVLAGIISEGEYTENVNVEECGDNLEEGGIFYTILELAQKVIESITNSLSDPSSHGLSPILKQIGMNRGDVFQLLADAGIISGTLYGAIKYLGKDMRNRLAEKIKFGLNNLVKYDIEDEPREPLKNTFKDPNRI